MLAPVDRIEMLRQLPIADGRVCEAGVWKGDFARRILAMQPRELVLVDPWRPQDPAVYSDWMNVSSAEYEAVYAQVAALFGGDPRVRIVRALSLAAAAQEADGAFSLVYLDANHSPEAVAADIDAWWPKVKPGGWLAGHDWSGCWPGVAAAVRAFLARTGLALGCVTGEAQWQSWGVRKP